jgi:hypothetical protein
LEPLFKPLSQSAVRPCHAAWSRSDNQSPRRRRGLQSFADFLVNATHNVFELQSTVVSQSNTPHFLSVVAASTAIISMLGLASIVIKTAL